MNLRDIALGTVVYPLAAIRADESTTRDVQSRLLSWGYQPGPADGDWGSRTEDAYVAFARDYSYSTNTITPATAGHLVSLAFRSLKAIANQSSTFTLFSLRDNPILARSIQDRLTVLGYSPGPIDGDWGKSTQAAFTAFAQANQFPSDRLSPKAAQKLLGADPIPVPPPPVTNQPQPPPVPPTDVIVPTEPDNSQTLRDIALGTVTYPLSQLRSNVKIARDIQFRLSSWGYQPGPVDGDWGGLTEKAFITFARDYGYLNQSLTPQAAAHLASLAFRSLSQIAAQSSTFTLFSIKRNPLIAKDVQQQLKIKGYYTGPIDGDWGSGTQAAYDKFATANNFPTDRMPPQAARTLIASSAPPSPPTPPTTPPRENDPPANVVVPKSLSELRRSQYRWPLDRLAKSNSFIKELQQALSAMGHSPGPIDGVWGGRTKAGYEAMASVYGAEKDRISPRVAKLLLEPEVPRIKVITPPKKLNNSDYVEVARMIGTNTATIRAVVEVEAAGSGYFSDGRPKILFEAHWFSAFTNSRYDYSYPSISSPVWNRSLYIGGVGEWDRLYKAVRLDRAGALKSASWGLGQVMGFNHVAAGYSNVEDFVKDMHTSEGKQLMAMFNFINYNGLAPYLVRRDWAGFALRYNGEGYRVNQYDVRLAQAYNYWRNVA
ncbi:DUF3380 domain-containing protein [filamentous cyanobacterium LEGE 11480]|uniref:DUF3380 domain-containing protein n=1 Tax=Romeriopsis navalis LEGE 11480 TaxID=2777977 RepID=A0A928VL80_9CYAN|nr:N-acetylmuramidase domain-containing protein [Romeriopsis navalis]MBE9028417.1 DUF3380 domain-containing protein [Romeriopsis navalis LEGE 11480]